MSTAEQLERGGENGAGAESLISVRDLVVDFDRVSGLPFARRHMRVRAVDHVSLEIAKGETLALVGESGSGKSTLGRAILQIRRPSSGSVRYRGHELTELSERQRRQLARELQLIFQDPFSSLDPRMTVAEIVAEPLRVTGVSRREARTRALEALEVVGFGPAQLDRRPHQFSGGQRQRVAIARALVTRPEFLVCDEPVSALDVSVQAQVLNLLSDLQEEFELTFLFVSHDLAVVRHIADRVAVMYFGQVVELAPISALDGVPLHPYTIALLSAVPEVDPQASRARPIVLRGDPPSAHEPPPGCPLSSRCWLRSALGNPERCDAERPPLQEVEPGWSASCHFATDPQARELAAGALAADLADGGAGDSPPPSR